MKSYSCVNFWLILSHIDRFGITGIVFGVHVLVIYFVFLSVLDKQAILGLK